MTVIETICPNCGDRGIGLLGIHEWDEVIYSDASEGINHVVHRSEEEWGTPCPTCGKEASDEQMQVAGLR